MDYTDGLPTPLSIRDITRGVSVQGNFAFPVLDSGLPVADPCPRCGAFNLDMGDVFYSGVCKPCAWFVYRDFDKEIT